MPRLHALELLPDPAGDVAVRGWWGALRAAGLPSGLDHRGATNAPHLTLLAAPALPASVRALAAERLEPLLPVDVRASGLLLLGGARVTLARVVDVPDDLLAAVLALRRATAAAGVDLPHPGWLPHLSLGRRLERADAQRAVDALGWDDVVVRLTTLRRWDPAEGAAGAVHVLAGPPPADHPSGPDSPASVSSAAGRASR